MKNCIVLIDSTPYRQWYESHYALPLGRKKGAKLVRVWGATSCRGTGGGQLDSSLLVMKTLSSSATEGREMKAFSAEEGGRAVGCDIAELGFGEPLLSHLYFLYSDS